MSTLPILVPGRTEPVHVPCRLPECFTFTVFLPSRGLRTFTAWLSSTDPLKAEVKDVVLDMPETDPRHVGGPYELDDDEQRRADEAAGDVIDTLLGFLALNTKTRAPFQPNDSEAVRRRILHAIALSWHAEEIAVERQTMLCHALDVAGLRDASRDAYAKVPDLTARRGQDASPSVEALGGYVEHVVDVATSAQKAKAEKQKAEWTPPQRHPEDVNPPAWAEP